MKRRLFLGAAGGLTLLPWRMSNAAGQPRIHVFKTPVCDCCGIWVDHLRSNGFKVDALDLDDLSATKHMAGVPDHLITCHTGIIESYIIEGHIPAAAIKKLLAERPAIQGLAVPGMPAGSPGMPSATPERYDVIAFGAGRDRVYMSFVGTDPV